MRELPDFAEVKAAWLDQPEEKIPIDIESIYRRRTEKLFSTTRSEVLSSIGAALFFASVVAWRFAAERNHVLQFGCVAVIAWAAVTMFRFRSAIRHSTPQPDAFARTGLDHYRTELLRRRDHLRSAWIWHGPLWLASIVSTAALAGRIVPGRLWDALPVFVVLVVWSVIGIRRRLRQAAELQQEIDELTDASPTEG